MFAGVKRTSLLRKSENYGVAEFCKIGQKTVAYFSPRKHLDFKCRFDGATTFNKTTLSLIGLFATLIIYHTQP